MNTRRAMLTGRVLVPAMLGLVFFAGCGGSTYGGASTNKGSATSPPPGIIVAVSPAAATVQAGQSQQFTATVQNDPSNMGVSWSIPTGGCTAETCGTIDATGKLTVPATITVPLIDLVVKATSVADPTKAGTATFAITLAPTGVSVFPLVAFVPDSGSLRFFATVSPGSGTNQAVTWSVSGAGCSGAACGAVDASGVFTAPATAPAPPTLTITATSVGDPTKSGSATVNLGGTNPNNAGLNGQYAFLLSGFDSDGFLQAAGSFTADGIGNITAGTEDVSPEVPGVITGIPLTGTYSVGADNRGSMALALGPAGGSPTGPGPGVSSFSFVLSNFTSAVAGRGRITLFDADGNGDTATGILVKQDPRAFSTAAIVGGYAFGFAGLGSRGSFLLGAAGRFTASGGSLTAGEMDVSDGGGGAVSQSFTGTYSVDATGRGTAMLATGPPGLSHFVFYVASASELLFIQTDERDYSGPYPAISGSALQQSGGPFSAGSVNGPSVLNLTGAIAAFDSPTSKADVLVAQSGFDGVGNLSGTLEENNSGAITSDSPLAGTYRVDADGLGRGEMSLAGDRNSYAFYLVSPGKGFVVDSSARAGGFEPQTGGPFTSASLSGTYALGTLPLPMDFALDGASGLVTGSSAEFRSGVVTVGADGSLQGTWDGAGTLEGFAGTYSVAANGRTTLTLAQSSGTSSKLVLYFLSPSKAVAIDQGSARVIVLEK